MGDFDATFPIMFTQFWLLEKFLDKTWIQPLSKVIEERNEKVKNRVANVKGSQEEIDALEAQAAKILEDARKEAADMKAAAKKANEKKFEEEDTKAKVKLEKEFNDAVKAMNEAKEAAMKADVVTDEDVKSMVAKILPAGMKLD